MKKGIIFLVIFLFAFATGFSSLDNYMVAAEEDVQEEAIQEEEGAEEEAMEEEEMIEEGEAAEEEQEGDLSPEEEAGLI